MQMLYYQEPIDLLPHHWEDLAKPIGHFTITIIISSGNPGGGNRWFQKPRFHKNYIRHPDDSYFRSQSSLIRESKRLESHHNKNSKKKLAGILAVKQMGGLNYFLMSKSEKNLSTQLTLE